MARSHGESDAERLARLETQMEEVQKSQEQEQKDIEEIKESLNTILKEFSRYKGFLGGLMFVGSCIGIFFEALPYIGKLFGKGS